MRLGAGNGCGRAGDLQDRPQRHRERIGSNDPLQQRGERGLVGIGEFQN